MFYMFYVYNCFLIAQIFKWGARYLDQVFFQVLMSLTTLCATQVYEFLIVFVLFFTDDEWLKRPKQDRNQGQGDWMQVLQFLVVLSVQTKKCDQKKKKKLFWTKFVQNKQEQKCKSVAVS